MNIRWFDQLIFKGSTEIALFLQKRFAILGRGQSKDMLSQEIGVAVGAV